jgi:propionyl-CoA carboxylase alpha chain
VTKPRHIEFQIFGDKHGNVIHLFERECSIQRRHQKVVEEAPSSILTPERRNAMGEAAINVAKSCGYYGAGTVEFILDENSNFYFLEMNTRLQVEHPVTEQITGIDLVKLQIKVAEGEKLPFSQSDLSMQGHAVEVRVYAEDPTNNFLPDIGTLKTYRRPQGHGVRVDDGFEEGMDIPFYYDPMIAKLITHAENRQEAINKMIRAIDEYEITGLETTLGFCRFVMQHEAFTSGKFDTRFVENYFKPEVLQTKALNDEERIASVLAVMFANGNKKKEAESVSGPQSISKWKKNRLV